MLKEMWKKKSTKAWAITSIALASLAVAAPIVLNVAMADLLDFAFGAPAPIFKDGEQSAYVAGYKNRNEASENANDVNTKLNEEGMVLLKNKNNALPVAKGSKVSVFGKNSVNIAIGGSGSGAAKGDEVSIAKALEESGYVTNPVLSEFYKSSKSGEGRSSNPGDLDSGKAVFLETGETPQSAYTEKVKASYSEYSDLAVVVFTRIGGE